MSGTPGRWRRCNLLPLQRVLAFDDEVEPVAGYIPEDLAQAARPANLNLIGAGAEPEPEVGSWIALRYVAPATRNLTNLRDASRPQLDAGSHGIPIAACADQLEIDEVISRPTTRRTVVVKQQRRISVIPHHHIDVTVVIEVGESDSPPDVRRRESTP